MSLDTNEMIGWCGLKLLTEPVNGRVNFYDLGYRFKQRHWGKGYASEACNAFFKDFSGLFQIKDFVPENWELLLGNDEQSLLMEAICEFSKRMKCQFKLPLGQFCSSSVVGKYMIDVLGDEKQEALVCFFLDTKNQVLEQKKIFKGTLNSATVHPREIFKEALRLSTARIIVVHNHPSGDTTPSENDLSLTKRLEECGYLLGIELLDHIIVGNSSYLSMREENIIG